ncbi:MAG: MupG family TIM beta-alpha barrel fold protein [Phascolarctobacterium sp.]|nr:MupG family TIM beta-alpha barrel fold protein [Phascolarctobacterium sp.]
MKNGISIYFGLDNTLEENLELINKAHGLGIKRIFTSLQIPETDGARLKPELKAVLDVTRQMGIEVIADVNATLLKGDPNLAALGIQRLRLDDGYNFHEISSLSRRFPISLNASTLDGAALKKLARLEMNFDNTEASFNFYPHPFTGQTAELVYERTKLLKAFGVRVSAFVSSQNRRRGPLHQGLPTIELQRNTPVSIAAFQLACMGVDGVFIGDSLPSEEELKVLAKLNAPSVLEIPCDFAENTVNLREQIFTVRPDISPYIVRSLEARKLFANTDIVSMHTTTITRGSILLDNNEYGRYKGELGLSKLELPCDSKVNVLGKIKSESLYLLDCLWPGVKFKFV